MPNNKNGAAHWPTNSAVLSSFVLQHFNAAEIPIAASEAAKNKIDGILEVCF